MVSNAHDNEAANLHDMPRDQREKLKEKNESAMADRAAAAEQAAKDARAKADAEAAAKAKADADAAARAAAKEAEIIEAGRIDKLAGNEDPVKAVAAAEAPAGKHPDVPADRAPEAQE